MKRRCEFLDNCPAFNYNPGASEYVVTEKGERQRNDTTQLGSTLMHAMLNEVSDFCDPIIRENWALKPHHQVSCYAYVQNMCTKYCSNDSTCMYVQCSYTCVKLYQHSVAYNC